MKIKINFNENLKISSRFLWFLADSRVRPPLPVKLDHAHTFLIILLCAICRIWGGKREKRLKSVIFLILKYFSFYLNCLGSFLAKCFLKIVSPKSSRLIYYSLFYYWFFFFGLIDNYLCVFFFSSTYFHFFLFIIYRILRTPGYN